MVDLRYGVTVAVLLNPYLIWPEVTVDKLCVIGVEEVYSLKKRTNKDPDSSLGPKELESLLVILEDT